MVTPNLTLLPEDVGQRNSPLREACNGLRYITNSSAPWRLLPHNRQPWGHFISRPDAALICRSMIRVRPCRLPWTGRSNPAR